MRINKVLYLVFVLLIFQNEIICQELSVEIESENNLCYNSNDGSAITIVSGGTPPYTYLWSNSADTQEVSGLEEGVYTVTVEDFTGSTASAIFIISEPTEIYYITNTKDASCFGSSDGEASIYVQGGTPPYFYVWSNTEISLATITAEAGNYAVTVLDDHSCEITANLTIDEPSEIIVLPISDRTICIGQSVTLSTSVVGGIPLYDFIWSDNNGTISYSSSCNVSPDETTTYHLVVQDSHGCSSQPQTITVYVMPEITIENFTYSDDELCLGEYSTINFIPIGGNGGPYQVEFEGLVVSLPYSFYPQETGWYSYTLRDLCSTPPVTDSIYITVNQNSIYSNLFAEYKVFPNPVKEIIYFENIPKKTNYEVINSKGELIESGVLNNDKIDMSSYSGGTYFIKLFKDKQEFIITKIIVE